MSLAVMENHNFKKDKDKGYTYVHIIWIFHDMIWYDMIWAFLSTVKAISWYDMIWYDMSFLKYSEGYVLKIHLKIHLKWVTTSRTIYLLLKWPQGR